MLQILCGVLASVFFFVQPPWWLWSNKDGCDCNGTFHMACGSSRSVFHSLHLSHCWAYWRWIMLKVCPLLMWWFFRGRLHLIGGRGTVSPEDLKGCYHTCTNKPSVLRVGVGVHVNVKIWQFYVDAVCGSLILSPEDTIISPRLHEWFGLLLLVCRWFLF